MVCKNFIISSQYTFLLKDHHYPYIYTSLTLVFFIYDVLQFYRILVIIAEFKAPNFEDADCNHAAAVMELLLYVSIAGRLIN